MAIICTFKLVAAGGDLSELFDFAIKIFSNRGQVSSEQLSQNCNSILMDRGSYLSLLWRS